MTMAEKQVQPNNISGAIRFQVNLPMRLRIFGERVWREAWIETMSVTEVLFRSSTDVGESRGMDIRITLPSPQSGAHGGTIVAKAKAVRCLPASDPHGQFLTVASISGARLLHFAEDRDSIKG